MLLRFFRKAVAPTASLLLLGSLVLLSACSGIGAQPTPTPVPASELETPRIVADGRAVPLQSVDLSFRTSGIVAEILVAEGEQVATGAPLARLDPAELDARVAQAEAGLAQANARYEQLLAGATPEEIAASEARLAQARATARQTGGSVTSQDLAAAQAELEEARATLARLTAGPKDTTVEQVRAAVVQAQANMAAQRDALSTAKNDAELRLSQAANALRDAQDTYSRIHWENVEYKDQLGSNEDLPQSRVDAEAAALRAVQDGEAAVEQARLDLDHARQAEISGLQAADAGLKDAQARLDELLAGADADQLAAAHARVAAAAAAIARLTGDQRSGQVDAANAVVTQAEAELAQVKADPRSTDLALADAAVRAADAELSLARIERAKAEIVAPFAATVVEINLTVGELPDETQPAVVLADTSRWQIETSDLTELDASAVRPGAPVTISFDALPDLELPGVVSRIKGLGKSYQGDVIYTVVVEPKSWDERILWNMTATVAIEPAR